MVVSTSLGYSASYEGSYVLKKEKQSEYLVVQHIPNIKSAYQTGCYV